MPSRTLDAEAIRAAVDSFYARMLDDPLIGPAFAGVDLRRLKAHQRTFLIAALGGPALYTGREMHEAHLGLGISDAAFDATLAHLRDALDDAGLDATIADRACAEVAALRRAIVEQ